MYADVSSARPPRTMLTRTSTGNLSPGPGSQRNIPVESTSPASRANHRSQRFLHPRRLNALRHAPCAGIGIPECLNLYMVASLFLRRHISMLGVIPLTDG